MQDNLFSDLSQILPHLARLQNNIERLRFLSKQLDNSLIEIFMTLPDGVTITIDEFIVPFNLNLEIKTLFEDSIDEYQRQHDHLNKLNNESAT